MSERMKFQGRLAVKELDARALKLKIEGLRDAMRDKLDPFEDVAELDLDVVAQQAVEAATALLEYREILDEIKALKKALGK